MAHVDQFDGVIFDYGGVLVAHQSDADQARLAASAGLTPTDFTELYWARRAEYDRGEMTAAEYWLEIGKHGRATFDERRIDELTDLDSETWMRFDEAMWAWVNELRSAGKKVAMLSNMPLDLGQALRGKTDRLERFDQVTLSYEVRSAKPEPVIYEHCLEGLGTLPERTLFLDDRIENVQGAELLGIRAMQFLERDHVLLQMR